MEVLTPSKAKRQVFVTFSSHTFTRGLECGDPAEHVCYDNRIFCEQRYELSRQLALIVMSFPTARVFQTWERRSYVYLAKIELGEEGGIYHIFFGLKRRDAPRGINLSIESAYRKDISDYTPPRKPHSVRFGLLIEKVFAGQPLKFK